MAIPYGGGEVEEEEANNKKRNVEPHYSANGHGLFSLATTAAAAVRRSKNSSFLAHLLLSTLPPTFTHSEASSFSSVQITNE